MTAEQFTLLAGMAGLEIDPAYQSGVSRNLEILLEQAALLFDPPINPLVEPAPVYRP